MTEVDSGSPVRPLRGFLSYSTLDRKIAADVKAYAAELGVDCFTAHDDLVVSDEWKERIKEELRQMEVFIALLSKAFKSSDWAPQELGFAVARADVPIIPLSIDGTVSFGFIGHLQSKRLTEPLTDALFIAPLRRHYPRLITPALIARMARARGFRHAEALMEPLRPVFKDFVPSEIDAFAEACIANGQIWDAALCATEYIPEFIELHREKIRPERLKVLEYQIEKRRWYREDDEG